MKSYHRHLILTGLLSIVLSCSKSEGEAPSNYPEENKGRIYSAVIDTAETKTILEGKSVIWQETDKVAVFTSPDKQLYKVKEGCAGTKSTTLIPANNTVGGSFKSTIAFYPYDAALSCKESDDGYYNYYYISLNLPDVQKYVPLSFGTDVQPMYAVSNDSESTSLSFKNICGLLKIRLKGKNIIVKKIEIVSNSNEKIAGQATQRISKSGYADQNMDFSEESTSSIILDCGDGVALNANTSTDFYIALPPTNFRNGVTMRVTTTNDIIEKKTSSISILRSHITPMPELVLIGNRQRNNQILYATKYPQMILGCNTIECNAKFVSDEYKDSQGIQTFDNPIDYIVRIIETKAKDLVSLILPDGLTRIGKGAFARLHTLKSVVIPNSVTTIGKNAFNGCNSLQSIKIPNSVTTIEEGTFDGCTALESVTIPEGVTIIDYRSFRSCYKLPSIVIPKSVTKIEKEAFKNCTRLKSIDIPNGVTLIGEDTFYDCDSLQSITIPNSVTAIGSRSFFNCI